MTVPRALLLTLLVAILALGFTLVSRADGRADWEFYARQTIDVSDCLPVDGALECPTYRQKWDWKRDQWVNIGIILHPASGDVTLTQQLEDRDSYDDDHVCVTALIVDAQGRNLVAHHQNWSMTHGQVAADIFSYASPRLAETRTIHIGSKQCRQGPHQDDALYARVLAGIPD